VTSTPTLSPHFPRFHDGERPPKRRRRDSSGKHSDNTAHSVIDLAEEDDDPFPHPHSLVIDAALVPGDLSPSPPTSHRSGSHHKPKNSPIRVHEFRAVEKIIKCPNNQRRNILGKTDMDLIEIPDDPPTAESISMENSKTHDNENQCCTKNLAFESTESGDPSEPHKLPTSEEPCNLRTRFVSTDGRQRTADIRESPDELQGDVTVGPAPLAPTGALQNTRSPNFKSPVAKNRRSFSSDIRPTRFANHKRLSPTATRKIRSKTGHKTSYRILYIHYESFKRSAADGECMYLLFDQDRESFVISMNGEESPQVPVIFSLHRIAMVRHGPESCPKVQLKFRKAEGNFDITADLEFSSSEEMASFLKHLELNSIRTLRKER
jgi:sentrin-specific protease 7